jgi:hypothetical protein
MAYAYSVYAIKNVANVSTDRILILKVNGIAKDTRGLLERRIFAGDNKIHAIQDSGLWYLRYEKGGLPEGLKQRWTNFNQLMKFVTGYFKSRNIDVEEVIS